MQASIAIQILPGTESNEETVRIVDEVIAMIQSKGLRYEVGAFETTVEGDFDTLMQIVKESHQVALKAGATRVSAYIKTAVVEEGHLLTIDEKITKHKQ